MTKIVHTVTCTCMVRGKSGEVHSVKSGSMLSKCREVDGQLQTAMWLMYSSAPGVVFVPLASVPPRARWAQGPVVVLDVRTLGSF